MKKKKSDGIVLKMAGPAVQPPTQILAATMLTSSAKIRS
jgi:hypothetical protein